MPVSMPITQDNKRTTAKTTKTTKKSNTLLSVRDYQKEISDAKAVGNIITVGIDPGSRNVGFSVRDDKENVFMSSTFYRPDSMSDPVEWSRKVIEIVREELKTIDYDIIGIESVTAPTGFKYGQKDALNPKDIIYTGIIVGALATAYPDAYIIRPRGNGDRPLEEYPDSIQGRRPKDLPGRNEDGVKVRKHERSAYDVAGHTIFAYIQSR